MCILDLSHVSISLVLYTHVTRDTVVAAEKAQLWVGERAGNYPIYLPLPCRKRVWSVSAPSTCASFSNHWEKAFGSAASVAHSCWKVALLNLLHRETLRRKWSWSWLSHPRSASHSGLAKATPLWYSQTTGRESPVCFLCCWGVILSGWTEAWERLPNEVVMMVKRLGLRECSGSSTAQTVSCFWP